MLGDILNSQKPLVELTAQQVAFMQLDAIGESTVRQWLISKEVDRAGRSQSVEDVASVKPTYEILKMEEDNNEREADYHEPN